MLKKVSLTAIALLSLYVGFSQDSTAEKPKPVISGSIDAYYRYNFQNAKDEGHTNNYTSFTNSQNSFELGMASVRIDYTTGKVTGVLDLGFGKRAEEFSYTDVKTVLDGNGDPTTTPTLLAAVKQGYVSYAPSDKVKLTMGKWATHVGYELLDPQLNRNYSMSYMFSYGPFSHTGLKADFVLSSHFGAMVGIANPTDFASFSFAKKFGIAQVSATFDKISAYLNWVGGKDLGDNVSHQFGLTAVGKVSDKFSIGYDGTVKMVKPSGGSSDSWWGSALYFNFDPTSVFGLTLRGEYFDDKKGVAGFGTSLFDATLSLNIKPTEYLTIIPEFRLDSSKDPLFYKNSDIGIPSEKSTGTFLLAAIVHF
jgi:hypothetical protein